MRSTKSGLAPTSLNALQFHYALLQLRKIVRSWIQRVSMPLHEPAKPEVANVGVPGEPGTFRDFSIQKHLRAPP